MVFVFFRSLDFDGSFFAFVSFYHIARFLSAHRDNVYANCENRTELLVISNSMNIFKLLYCFWSDGFLYWHRSQIDSVYDTNTPSVGVCVCVFEVNEHHFTY